MTIESTNYINSYTQLQSKSSTQGASNTAVIKNTNNPKLAEALQQDKVKLSIEKELTSNQKKGLIAGIIVTIVAVCTIIATKGRSAKNVTQKTANGVTQQLEENASQNITRNLTEEFAQGIEESASSGKTENIVTETTQKLEENLSDATSRNTHEFNKNGSSEIKPTENPQKTTETIIQNSTKQLEESFRQDYKSMNAYIDNLLQNQTDPQMKKLLESTKTDLNNLIYKIEYTMSTKNPEIGLLQNLISFRDNIIIRKGLAKDSKDAKASEFLALFEKLDTEISKIFSNRNVKIIEQTGKKFDQQTQSCRNIIETKNPELHDIVAETFRPGYRLETGEIIRPHEVILYKYK